MQNKIKEANELFQSGNFAQAQLSFASLTQADPSSGIQIISLDGQGRCFFAMEKLPNAIAAFEKCLKLMQEAFGQEHQNVALSLQNLARAYSAADNHAAAIAAGEKAAAILQKISLAQAEPDPSLKHAEATAQFTLSAHHYKAQDLDNAEACLLKAMTIWEQLSGAKSMEVSSCLNNLGRIYEQRGNPKQGVAYHRQAVAIRIEILGYHPETAFSLANLGSALAEAGELDHAIAALTEALHCYSQVGMLESNDAATCRRNLESCIAAVKKNKGV